MTIYLLDTNVSSCLNTVLFVRLAKAYCAIYMFAENHGCALLR